MGRWIGVCLVAGGVLGCSGAAGSGIGGGPVFGRESTDPVDAGASASTDAPEAVEADAEVVRDAGEPPKEAAALPDSGHGHPAAEDAGVEAGSGTAPVVARTEPGPNYSTDCYPVGGCHLESAHYPGAAAGAPVNGERYRCTDPGDAGGAQPDFPRTPLDQAGNTVPPCGLESSDASSATYCCDPESVTDAGAPAPACSTADSLSTACMAVSGYDASAIVGGRHAFVCPNDHPTMTTSNVGVPVSCVTLAAPNLPSGAAGDAVLCCPDVGIAPTGASP